LNSPPPSFSFKGYFPDRDSHLCLRLAIHLQSSCADRHVPPCLVFFIEIEFH
jgi:hypothetical protein